ncbi:MAG: hypothetical protein JW827_09730 [Spirochaetes bacterium]|nr:hypothetical protein [Spirochaetota bacterium]
MASKLYWKKGETYLIRGENHFSLLEGAVEAIGKKILKGEEDSIPSGKCIPFEILTDSTVSLDDVSRASKVDSRTIPSEWDELLERIKKEQCKRIIILGQMDTGKSFLSTYLANKLIQNNKKIGIIDSDLGQSDIGPPTTMGLTILREPFLFLSKSEIHSLEFVGALSPALHISPLIASFSKIIEKAKGSSDIVIINTDGWVHGDGARSLKLTQLDIFKPDIVVLLQRQGECEHLVKTVFPGSKVIRLKASSKASETSKGDRDSLRNLSSQKFFTNSKEFVLSFNEFETERCFFKTGTRSNAIPQKVKENVIYLETFPSFEGCLVVSEKRLNAQQVNILNTHHYTMIKNILRGDERGMILGLLDEGKNVLSLGILKAIDFKKEKIKIISPFQGNISRIKIIQFGSIRYTEEGKENGFVEPGSI